MRYHRRPESPYSNAYVYMSIHVPGSASVSWLTSLPDHTGEEDAYMPTHFTWSASPWRIPRRERAKSPPRIVRLSLLQRDMMMVMVMMLVSRALHGHVQYEPL